MSSRGCWYEIRCDGWVNCIDHVVQSGLKAALDALREQSCERRRNHGSQAFDSVPRQVSRDHEGASRISSRAGLGMHIVLPGVCESSIGRRADRRRSPPRTLLAVTFGVGN